MAKKSKVEWLKMGPAPHFATCERCGEHVQAPKMPIPVNEFVEYLDAQIELHRYCKEKEADGG